MYVTIVNRPVPYFRGINDILNRTCDDEIVLFSKWVILMNLIGGSSLAQINFKSEPLNIYTNIHLSFQLH